MARNAGLNEARNATGTERAARLRMAVLALVSVLSLGLAALPAAAQEQPAEPAPDAAVTASPTNSGPPPWSARCSSASRDAKLDCQIEQRAVVTETGQLLLLVTIGVPGESRQPMLSIRTPLQMFLPAGVRVDVDGRNAQKLDYQTCDQQGCYTRAPISNALLEAMFKGLKLNIIIESINRQQLTVPMSLEGFTQVYNRVR
ncbi:invasion protein IalB [Amorphus suaedae]